MSACVLKMERSIVTGAHDMPPNPWSVRQRFPYVEIDSAERAAESHLICLMAFKDKRLDRELFYHILITRGITGDVTHHEDKPVQFYFGLL